MKDHLSLTSSTVNASSSSSLVSSHNSPRPSHLTQEWRLYVPVPPQSLQRLGATILLSFPLLPQMTTLFSLSSESQCSHFKQNLEATLTGSPNFRSPKGQRVIQSIFPFISYLISVNAFPFMIYRSPEKVVHLFLFFAASSHPLLYAPALCTDYFPLFHQRPLHASSSVCTIVCTIIFIPQYLYTRTVFKFSRHTATATLSFTAAVWHRLRQ